MHAKLSSIIFYVDDILGSLAFYKKAFGIETTFIHESELYAELKIGRVTLAFASDILDKDSFSQEHILNSLNLLPQTSEMAFTVKEIVFTVKDVAHAYKKALQEGAVDVAQPTQKAGGQTVAYVRDLNGILIEIVSEMA